MNSILTPCIIQTIIICCTIIIVAAIAVSAYRVHPLAELSQCILDSSNGSIINVI